MFEDFKEIVIEMGNVVICDYCNKDWTDEKESGGLLFQSNAVCPDCADRAMKNIKKYNEESFIRGICPENLSFADWVRSVR